MHIVPTIALVLSALPAVFGLAVDPRGNKMKFHCFPTGRDWGKNHDRARQAMAHACNHTLGNHYYTEFQKARDCYALDGNLHVDFIAQLQNYPDRPLDPRMCFDRMDKLMLCPRGGSYRDDNWFFVADPNEGAAC